MGSLNHVFRTIWSEVLGTWIAVSEITKAKGKRSGSSVVRTVRAVTAQAGAIDERGGRLKPILFALACCFVVDVQANPEGGVVVSGNASFNAVGNTLTVTNTPGTIINWQGFSINANEVTHFAQQSAASAVLNRVVTNNPSAILGTLSSNGQVYLVNPNGIVFGSGATVDVAGLVATSLNLSDADFLAGRHNYTDQAGAQNISNAGNINAQQGGQIYLIAPNVENTGIITAPNGEILLVAGHEVQLVNSLDPSLRVSIVAPAGEATNLGQLIVQSGSLGLFGAVVRNTGAVSADSATLQGGKIVFKSSQRTEIGGTVTATGTTGGTIEALSSNEVRVSAGASIDASGTNGGGTILVGGDKQGLNPDVVNAKTTYVDVAATIKADAVQNGDGGKVIVWADEATHAHGSITARGGANGGNGGFVETSAHYLDVAGIRVDASAPKGAAGMWLLDPSDVHISATEFGGVFAGGVWTPNTTPSYISTGTILSALDTGTSVTVMTASASAGNGDIFVDAPIDKTAGTAATLTLLAERNITFANGTGISSTSGALNVVLRSDADANGTGTVSFAGTNTLNALAGGRVDLYYNPASYAAPTTFTGINWGATAHTEWMLVNNVTNLQDMNTNLAGNYALGAAFDASGTTTWNFNGTTYDGFAPIGNISTPFTGSFNGNAYAIDGLYINRPATDYVGLFGYTNLSTIKDVSLTNVNISGYSYVGSLVGWHQGTLTNSHNATGTVTGMMDAASLSGNHVGGLVGMNYNGSTITGSSAGSTVQGDNYVGGLVGTSQSSTISNSSASGAVTGTQWYVGGLVGDSYNTDITNGTATGNVASESFVGGLVGRSGFSSSINNGIASGTVTSTVTDAGGLVGKNAGVINGNSHATGVVLGVTNVGGLVGNNGYESGTYGSVSNSYANTGAVTGTTNVGGLVGYTYVNTSIGTSNAGGAVAGNSNVGGLVGYNDRAAITTSFASGSVTGNGVGSTNLGGFAGYNDGTITNSYVMVASVSGVNNVGGLVGNNAVYVGYTNFITGSYVDGGSVTGTSNFGGLVGINSGTLTNSHYNINNVTINGANIVTLGGLYNDNTASFNNVGQYTDWLVNGLSIANYTSPYGSFASGGANIYIISNAQGLKDMLGFADNSAYTFVLAADIDLTTLGNFYIPILASDFDGANFTISNLSLVQNNSNLGMFGKVTSLGSVSNLAVQNATISSTVGDQIGGLAGANAGTITNSSVSAGGAGTVTVAGDTQVGGLVGRNDGTISNSSVSGLSGTLTVDGTVYVGGLVGEHFAGSIADSHVSAADVAGNNSVGGLAGMSFIGSSITNSYVDSGAVTATVGNIGGLVGRGAGTHSNSHFDIDNVTTNGGNNVTIGGLYNTGGTGQFNDWFNGGALTALVIGNYSSTLVLQGDSSYGIGTQQGLKDMLGFAEDPTYNFSLTTGISLIGMSGYYVPKLAGDFNGNTLSISNLSLNLPNDDMGLFGNIALGSLVSNFDLVNVAVSGMSYVGAVAGSNYGDVDTVTVSGTPLTVSGTSNVGRNVSSGVTTTPGVLTGGNISNSSVNGGTVTAGVGGGYVGGLVGSNTGNITNSDVLNTAVSGVSTVGGLVGFNLGATSSMAFFSGIITGSTVTNGSVTSTGGIGSGAIGGLVGNNAHGVIVDSYVINPNIVGGSASDVGGLVGINAGTGFSWPNGSFSISNSYVSGGTVGSTGNNVGGLAGYNFGAPIDASYVDSAVVNGGTSVGGLVGYDGGEGYGGGLGLISNSFVSNTQVTGTTRVGGFVGEIRVPTISGGADNFVAITNSYVSGGTVSGSTDVGGLVGFNDGEISMAYTASGLVSGTTNVGGLIGYNDFSAVVSNSFWDIDTTGRGLGAGFGQDWGYINTTGVAGLTTVERMAMSSFTGWNIANTGAAGATWRIYEGHTGPLLTSFLKQLVITADAASKTYDGAVYSGGLVNPTYTDGINPVVPNLPDILGTANAYGPNAINAGTYDPDLYSGQLGYDISYVGGMLTIGTASLGVISLNGTRVYDGTADVDWSIFTLAGLIGGQTLTLSGVGTVADANVGINKPVTLGTLALGDGTGLASNYTFTGGTYRATITAAPLTIGGSNVASKVYDGTASATVGAGVLSGLVGVETLGVSATGAFINKNVGTAKNVSVTYALSDGTGLASNYSLSNETLSADITARPVTLTAPSLTKIYDGGLGYNMSAADLANMSGALVGGDVVNAANITYVDKNVGVGKTVLFNSVAINDGNGGGNYSISLVGNSTSIINQENLIVAAMNLNKVLGTPDPALRYCSFGLHDPVAATLSGTLTRIAGDTIGSYAINQGSVTLLDTTNYYMTYVPGVFTILAPTVVQEITEISLLNTPKEDGPLTTEEEEKRLIEQLAAAGMINADKGAITEPLPLCR